MTSRLRGPSAVKEGSKRTGVSKNLCAEDSTEEHAFKPYRNGGKDNNRYLFGMTKHEEPGKNGREYKTPTDEDPDTMYRRSREHFGAWDIKDIIQKESARSKKPEDRPEEGYLVNGKHKTEGIRQQENSRQERYEARDEGYVGSLPREHRGRTESIEREHAESHASRRRENWDNVTEAKSSSRPSRVVSRTNGNKDEVELKFEDKDLTRDMENLNIDNKSPDRRIRALIERFKSREENKLKSRRERNSLSPDKEEHEGRSKSATRNDTRTYEEHSSDNWINDRSERSRNEVEERDGDRRSSRHKHRDTERSEESKNRRSRSTEKHRDSSHAFRDEDPRRTESFRQKSDAHNADKSYRRKSGDLEEEQFRVKDNTKRRSYVYEGNPEDFDVRIQKYERALIEPRKDPDLSRRSSSKDRDHDLGRKDSFKEHEKQASRKNSFKNSDSSKKRESSLNRKVSIKDQDSELYRKNSFKTQQESGNRYFGKEQETDVIRKNSFKEQKPDLTRKSSFKESNADYGKISFKNREDDSERKNSLRECHGGVSRITFKNHDADPPRINSYKDDPELGRVSSKEHANDVGRKNSFKEKSVEFGSISYKEPDDDIDRRQSYPEKDNDPTKSSFKDYDEPESSPSRSYEFGKLSYRDDDTVVEDHETEVSKKTSLKDRDSPTKRRVSLRSKAREVSDRKSERHSRPLTPPPKAEDLEEPKELDGFCSKSWLESNKLFSAKYLREHSRFRTGSSEGHSELEDREFSRDLVVPRLERVNNVTENDNKHELLARSESTEQTVSSARDTETRVTSTHERNGATIIRIRAADETVELRRRRHRPSQESYVERRRRQGIEGDEEDSEDEEEETDLRMRPLRREGGFMRGGSGGATPSRRVWNYREGGVLITDVEEGQPCLHCGGTCPGFSPHSWRKNCTSCKCPREAHDVCHEEWVSVRSRLGLKGDESSPTTSFDPREKGLAWAPPGLPAHKVEEYFSLLPEKSVPRLGTPGERQRDRQLVYQLPKQDLARAYCRHLNPKHASSADDFMAARNEIALDIGSVQEVLERDLDCGACNNPLKYGSLAVSASKLGFLYHPGCFRCNECKELLVDLAYCVHDDTLYCERHYAEQLKPRCAACDELIFSGEYTKAMNKDWHSGHFCCWQCDESLTGQRYVLRDEHPYCIKCYESVFANGCEECNKIIGIDSKDLSYKDKHWHEACFLCNRCRVSLVDKQFGSKVDKIYCGNCYDAQFASRCDGCGEIFRAGTKKMEYKTRQWHEKCFCCCVCKNPIGTKSFIPREQEIYCAGCYEDKFATRCVKCKKIITSGGVTYKNEPWHRDCFTCSNCNNSLAGQRFTSRDDKPYCADCFGELFAKRCTACSKPITGIGGTRFISFEDRHWHNDCFICAVCQTSLVGRGFITDGEDIICPDCAKAKLA